MPAPPPPVGLFLPANTWTQVEWYLGTFGLAVCFTAPAGVIIRWRWYSAGFPPVWPPPFLELSWSQIAQITLPAGFYTSLEFNPTVNTVVTRIASPC